MKNGTLVTHVLWDVKDNNSSLWENNHRAMQRYLLYGITKCYLPSDTGECACLDPSHAGRYSTYLPQRVRRLSWSWYLLHTILPVCIQSF